MHLRIPFCNLSAEEIKAFEDDHQLGPALNRRGGQRTLKRQIKGYFTILGLTELANSLSRLC